MEDEGRTFRHYSPSHVPHRFVRCTHKLGVTLRTPEELATWIEDIWDEFDGKYDVLTNNCNCFSNALVHFLTGKPIPEAVSKLPQLVRAGRDGRQGRQRLLW